MSQIVRTPGVNETDVLIGTLLQKRMKTAVEEHRVHKEELKAFTEGRSEDTEGWLKGILDWEEDQERPAGKRLGSRNPYEMPKGGMVFARSITEQS